MGSTHDITDVVVFLISFVSCLNLNDCEHMEQLLRRKWTEVPMSMTDNIADFDGTK